MSAFLDESLYELLVDAVLLAHLALSSIIRALLLEGEVFSAF